MEHLRMMFRTQEALYAFAQEEGMPPELRLDACRLLQRIAEMSIALTEDNLISN